MSLAEQFAELPHPKNAPYVSRMRGRLSADMLLLCPHPSGDDYKNNLPFTSEEAATYSYLMEQGGFDIDEDFLLVPCSRFGNKPSKGSTVDTLPFLRAVHKEFPKKVIVVVGMAAFSYVFAGGRKSHAATIIGNPMWIPSADAYVFVLPDPVEIATVSQSFKEQKKTEERLLYIQTTSLKLVEFLKAKFSFSTKFKIV